MSTALHINHQLNLDEVIRRMEYWALQGNTNVVLMLVHAVKKDKHNLCLDPEPVPLYVAQARRIADMYNATARAEARPDLEEE